MLNRDPGVHLRNLKTPAADRGGGDRAAWSAGSASRSARAATSRPRRASGSCCAARWRASREGSPVYEALLARLRARRDRDLRGRRHVRGRVPGGDRHRQADQGVSQRRAHAIARSGWRCRVARRYAAVERAARAGLRAGAALESALGTGRARAGDRRPARPGRRRARSVVAGRLGARRPRVAPGHRAAGRRGRLPARLRQPHLRQRRRCATARRCRRRWWRSPRRAGQPVWIPPDAAGHCCATPWSSKGYARGQRVRWPAGPPTRWCAGATGARCRWSSTPARAPTACSRTWPRSSTRSCASASTRSRCWTRSPGPTTGCCRASRSAAGWPPRPCTRPARPGTWAWPSSSRRVVGALADEVLVPVGTTCCGMAGDRGLLHPELPRSALRDVAARAGRPRARRLRVEQPHLRDRPAARDRPPVRVIRAVCSRS